jgi:RecJ-like exonuclease
MCNVKEIIKNSHSNDSTGFWEEEEILNGKRVYYKNSHGVLFGRKIDGVIEVVGECKKDCCQKPLASGDVVENLICPVCKGDGYLECKDCGGAGYQVKRKELGVKNEVVECEICEGTGDVICGICKGSGKVNGQIVDGNKDNLEKGIRDIFRLNPHKTKIGEIHLNVDKITQTSKNIIVTPSCDKRSLLTDLNFQDELDRLSEEFGTLPIRIDEDYFELGRRN